MKALKLTIVAISLISIFSFLEGCEDTRCDGSVVTCTPTVPKIVD